MKFQELLILLPCYGFEDFPHHHEGDDAESLLACWTAMWHPALIASAGRPPGWARVDSPPEDLRDRLLLVPTISSGELPTGFAQRAAAEGALLIRKPIDRQDILDAALGWLATPDAAGEKNVPADSPAEAAGLREERQTPEGSDAGRQEIEQPSAGSPTSAAVPDDLAADFLALGYAYLQIQILTRQMRYSSNLDEVHFNNQLLEAARQATDGDTDAAREKLGACFDLLAEERDHFYAVDAYLVDVTMTAATTMGEPLARELAGPAPGNLLVTGELLDEMARHDPETLTRIGAVLSEGRWGLIGGEATEPPLPLMSLEAILAELRRGRQLFERHLGRRAEVFGRNRFGLTPVLPQLLAKSGFIGAFHATLGDGRFPQGTQAKTRWEGNDGTGIDALAKVPLDAGRADTFLGLAARLSESMDMDHVATVCLAHWPGHASRWYEDLKRCAKYSSALGKFVTVEQYFRDTYAPGQYDRFDADEYRSPYLKQAVIHRRPDPLSTGAAYWRRRLTVEGVRTLQTLATLIAGAERGDSDSLDALIAEVDRHIESPLTGPLEDHLDEAAAAVQSQLSALLPREAKPPRPGYLIWNPLSFARRVAIDVSELAGPPNVGPPVYAVGEVGATRHAVVDLPPLGYVWLEAGDGPVSVKRGTPPLAENRVERDNAFVLRNEFFEALVNPTTGALQSLKDYGARGNRISQQLALRQPGPRPRPGDPYQEPDEIAEYSVMAADEVVVSASCPALGEITSRGRLLNRNGELLATFQQRYRVWRGSRVLQLDVEIDPREELAADPWNTYYACRFAWGDETAEITRGNQQLRFALTRNKRFEATDFVEIASGNSRTSILTLGLPYHRLVGSRRLDSLLLVRGETCRRFRLGIGIDVAQPVQDSLSQLVAPRVELETAPPPAPPSAWLFHFDVKNVAATAWTPLLEDGSVVGFRVRLLEIAGRSTRVRLSGMRPIGAARTCNFVGDSLGDLRVDEGRAVIELAGHEWAEIEARWA